MLLYHFSSWNRKFAQYRTQISRIIVEVSVGAYQKIIQQLKQDSVEGSSVVQQSLIVWYQSNQLLQALRICIIYKLKRIHGLFIWLFASFDGKKSLNPLLKNISFYVFIILNLRHIQNHFYKVIVMLCRRLTISVCHYQFEALHFLS